MESNCKRKNCGIITEHRDIRRGVDTALADAADCPGQSPEDEEDEYLELVREFGEDSGGGLYGFIRLDEYDFGDDWSVNDD